MAIGALGSRFGVSALCERLRIARSSYCYSGKAAQRPDPHAGMRDRTRAVFEQSNMTLDPERVWHALGAGGDGPEPVAASEKIVRRLMREEALVVIYGKKKRACSSCKGEIGEHPGNKVRRDFHVDGPNKLWLTDVTQFALTSCECSLSAIIDCLDGKVASHRLSRTPMRTSRAPRWPRPPDRFRPRNTSDVKETVLLTSASRHFELKSSFRLGRRFLFVRMRFEI